MEQEGKPANEEYVVKSDRSIKKAAQLEEMRKKLGQDNNMEEVTVEEDEDDKEWEDVDEDEDGFGTFGFYSSLLLNDVIILLKKMNQMELISIHVYFVNIKAILLKTKSCTWQKIIVSSFLTLKMYQTSRD